jgi:hypothetical protein
MTDNPIRRLNDSLRRDGKGGRLNCTRGVAALPPAKVVELLWLIRNFDGFTLANDPHGEHDFGAVELDGVRYFWKIDYYDRTMTYGSDDPADPAVTTRVLTVMLATDY